MRRAWLGLTVLLAAAFLGGLVVGRARAASSITIECADPSGPATTLCDVYLDPDIHHGSFGTVLGHWTSAGKRTISLPDSGHLAIRASANVSGGINTSVLVYNIGTACPQPGWRSFGYQSWWADTGQDPAFESRHIHLDNLCIPANNLIVDGPQTFTPTLQLHNQPAGARLTRIRLDDFLGSRTRRFEQTSGLPQPDSAGNLVMPLSIPVDLSKLPAGRHEFRFGAYVTQPNGKVQLLSTRVEIAVRSTSPSYRSISSFPYLQGNGAWYEKDSNPGYVDARIRSALP